MYSKEQYEQKKAFVTEIFQNLPKIEGRNKFQKLMFLGQKELSFPLYFAFTEQYYGPWSPELANLLDHLVSIGIITETTEIKEEDIIHTYRISETLHTKPEKTIPKDTITQLRKLEQVESSCITMYIYDKYPPHQRSTESALGELEQALEHKY